MSTSIPRGSVLVVEDDPVAREFYRSLLRAAGYTVTAVEDGLTALQIIDTRPPDTVVLDMVLPRLSGRDVYRELKARPATNNLPIVVVSGHDVSDLNEADFASVLQKPLDPDTLVTVVERSVAARRTVQPS